jgi:hypothetical protein
MHAYYCGRAPCCDAVYANQLRELRGTVHRVLKSFPTEAERRALVEPLAPR